MKKKIYYTILAILISVFSFITLANAEVYISEMTPRDKKIENVTVGKIKIDEFRITKIVNRVVSNGNKLAFDSKYTSEYTDKVTVYYTIRVYDKGQNLLNELKAEVEPNDINVGVYAGVMYDWDYPFSIDDVAFYVLEVEVPTEVDVFDGANRGAYFYQNFNTEINVLENNVYEYKQNFTSIFKGSSRAINFYIPYRHAYTDNNGKAINKRAIISNIKTSEDNDWFVENGNKVVTFGKSEPAILEKEFSIEYSYNVGHDKTDGNDMLVLYLIKDVNVSIDNYEFKVILPKEFEEDNISFTDEFGNRLENVEYEVNGNEINGKFNDLILADSTYLLKIVLPDNYFVNTTRNISSNTWVAFILPIVFMISTITICFISKRTKNKRNEHASLYLDEDIDSLELGYVLKGGVKETDISSLVFCLANKNYIEIEMNKGNYTIHKLNNYDGNNKLEEILMKRLFQNGDSVTRKDLKENLKNIKEEIEKSLKYKKGKRIYIRPALNYKLVFWLMVLVIYYVNMKDLLFEYQPSDILITVTVGFVGFIIMLGAMTSKKYQLIEKVLCVLAGLVLIVSPIILTSYMAFAQDVLYDAAYILGIIAIISIVFTSSLMSNRTTYGSYLYRKIIAYKNYLVNVSEVEIQEELEKNDKYFYDVLPFVLVMGMSDKFYEKFENLDLIEPAWYETSKFKLDDFYSEVKNIYSDFFIAIKNK